MPITTQNGPYEGDSPFFNRPWVWGQDDTQVYRDPNTGSQMLVEQSGPEVTQQDGGGGGQPGPTGPASTVPGPTGPTGAASIVPGPTGPQGIQGPTGGQGIQGPTGGQGIQGPTGPKGSFVSTESGVFELACMEGTRPYFFHVRHVEEAIPEPFLQAITGDLVRFPSHDGKHELCLAVRREFPDWFMPQSNEKQRLHSVKWWGNEYLPAGERGPTA